MENVFYIVPHVLLKIVQVIIIIIIVIDIQFFITLALFPSNFISDIFNF